MLFRLSEKLHRAARGWLILILFFVDAAFMFLILPVSMGLMKMDSGGPGPIDLLFIYTPARAYKLIAAYGAYGRDFYRGTELTVDIIYPVIYTLLLCLLISWLFRRGFPSQSRMQRWNLLPLGGWFFDLMENLGIAGMLSIYPSTPAALGWLTAGSTFLKWSFAGASIGLVLLGLVMAVRNRFNIQA